MTHRIRHFKYGALALFSAFCFFLAAEPVLAQVPGPGDPVSFPDGPVATGVGLWFILIGVAVRGLMYLINYHAPFLRTEPVKQVATALVAAVAGALYQVLFAGDFGLNDATLNAVVQVVIFTLVSHNVLYKPGLLNYKLGGGRNATGPDSDPKSARYSDASLARNRDL